jgi:hypothetical protein
MDHVGSIWLLDEGGTQYEDNRSHSGTVKKHFTNTFSGGYGTPHDFKTVLE